MIGRGLCLLLPLLCACQGAAPPPADAGAVAESADLAPVKKALVYSYVDDHGRIRMASRIEEIPAAFRDRVVVTDTAGSRAERLRLDRVVVVDLREQKDGQPLNYSLVDLDRLGKPGAGGPSSGEAAPRDPAALGRWVVERAGQKFDEALGLVPDRGPGAARVILYQAPWCGFCKKAAAYLREKGVAFEGRDIDADPTAAAELARKLKAAGLADSGIPVLDIGGSLVVGFNRERIEQLLKQR